MNAFSESQIYRDVYAAVPEITKIEGNKTVIEQAAEACRLGKTAIAEVIFMLHMKEVEISGEYEALGFDPIVTDPAIRFMRAVRYKLEEALVS